MSSSHDGNNRPYFWASHDECPRRVKCGGSKTTSRKELSAKGKALKSKIVSGVISITRPSQHVKRSDRQSPKTARESNLSNHIIRDPHAGSNT